MKNKILLLSIITFVIGIDAWTLAAGPIATLYLHAGIFWQVVAWTQTCAIAALNVFIIAWALHAQMAESYANVRIPETWGMWLPLTIMGLVALFHFVKNLILGVFCILIFIAFILKCLLYEERAWIFITSMKIFVFVMDMTILFAGPLITWVVGGSELGIVAAWSLTVVALIFNLLALIGNMTKDLIEGEPLTITLGGDHFMMIGFGFLCVASGVFATGMGGNLSSSISMVLAILGTSNFFYGKSKCEKGETYTYTF